MWLTFFNSLLLPTYLYRELTPNFEAQKWLEPSGWGLQIGIFGFPTLVGVGPIRYSLVISYSIPGLIKCLPTYRLDKKANLTFMLFYLETRVNILAGAAPPLGKKPGNREEISYSPQEDFQNYWQFSQFSLIFWWFWAIFQQFPSWNFAPLSSIFPTFMMKAHACARFRVKNATTGKNSSCRNFGGGEEIGIFGQNIHPYLENGQYSCIFGLSLLNISTTNLDKMNTNQARGPNFESFPW